MAGQVSQHRVVAELARRLPTVGELDLQATGGGPPQQLAVDLVGGVGAGHDQPVQVRCDRVGGGCDQAQPTRVVTLASAAIGTVRAAKGELA